MNFIFLLTIKYLKTLINKKKNGIPLVCVCVSFPHVSFSLNLWHSSLIFYYLGITHHRYFVAFWKCQSNWRKFKSFLQNTQKRFSLRLLSTVMKRCLIVINFQLVNHFSFHFFFICRQSNYWINGAIYCPFGSFVDNLNWHESVVTVHWTSYKMLVH